MAAGARSDKLRKMEDSKMPAQAERELVSIQRLVVAVKMGLAKRLIIQRRAEPNPVKSKLGKACPPSGDRRAPPASHPD